MPWPRAARSGFCGRLGVALEGLDRPALHAQVSASFPTWQARPRGSGNAPAQLALTADESLQAISAIAMRCGGCGAKVGATVLSRALGALQPVQRDDVLIGLHAPDDAAVVRVPPGKAMVHSVDFFRAFIDDPYLFGKVAANHALGDIFAMGAEPQSATAIATVPPGLEAKVEDLLFQMMTGAVEVLNDANCALVGGHTGEGKELALGFAVNGLIDDDMATVHAQGRHAAGRRADSDQADRHRHAVCRARARLAAKGRWIDAALQSMVLSNRPGAQCLREHGATACTDLTGFGLLGPPGGNDPALGGGCRTGSVGAAAAGRRRGDAWPRASSARCNRPTCACAARCATRTSSSTTRAMR